MTFDNIKVFVSANIGRKVAGLNANDTGILERSINLGVDELKRATLLSTLLKDLTSITLTSNINTHTIDSDTDIITRIAIQTSTQEGELDIVNSENILTKIRTTRDTGTPEFYRPFGSTAAGLPQIRTYPIYIGSPASASIIGEFMPILADLSGTSENQMTIKYFSSVIKVATLLAYRSLINPKIPPLQNLVTIETIVQQEAMKIVQRESGMGDYSAEMAVDSNLKKQRVSRFTQ